MKFTHSYWFMRIFRPRYFRSLMRAIDAVYDEQKKRGSGDHQ